MNTTQIALARQIKEAVEHLNNLMRQAHNEGIELEVYDCEKFDPRTEAALGYQEIRIKRIAVVEHL